MTSSAKTFLVRHGEVSNPDGVVYADLAGYPLSDRGRSQAAEAASQLPHRSTIVTSPLQRAAETAGIIAAQIDSTVLVDPALTEWRFAGRWAGHRWQALDDAFPGELDAYLDHPDRLPFADESLDALAERVVDAIHRHREATHGPLLIVSHQDPIQAARLSLTGRPLADLHQDKPAHASIVILEGTATTRWFERGFWSPASGDPFPPI
ncbi:MAG: histidine phosphatase family protein [Acidimicrobiia bacterium]|nr:MAG: histidine phosphatase family protein [Acidimicrobiia bacterium]